MNLFPGDRQPEGTGGLEGDGEGEVIRLDAVAEHGEEVVEGEGETAVANGAGD